MIRGAATHGFLDGGFMLKIKASMALLAVMALSSAAQAQTLRMMKSLDAPHYDGQRTTWSSARSS